jgi:hypothetical protein
VLLSKLSPSGFRSTPFLDAAAVKKAVIFLIEGLHRLLTVNMTVTGAETAAN